MDINKILFTLFHPFIEKVVRPPLHRLGLDLEIKAWQNECKNPYGALEPYLEFIRDYKHDQTHKLSEKIIWQFWWQGAENAPAIVKRCMQSVRKYAGDYRIVILDKDNIGQYVDLPDSIREKHDKGTITHTHLSDYIRVCLLEKYGGVWIDATVLLTGPIPQDILQSEFFFYRSPAWLLNSYTPSREFMPDFCAFNKSQGGGGTVGSSWFMVSRPMAAIPSVLQEVLELYWSKETALNDYFLLHRFMTWSIVLNQQCQDEFKAMPIYDNVKPHILQSVLVNKYDVAIATELKRMTPIHKLTYKFNSTLIAQNTNAGKLLSSTF